MKRRFLRYLENHTGGRWAIDLRRIGDAGQFLRAALGRATCRGRVKRNS